MRLSKYLSAFMIVAFAVTGAALHADTAAPADAPPAKKPAKQLSVPEMEAQSALILSDSNDDLRHVMALRDQTKKQKDVIKLSCVNDKLMQMKAQLNIEEKANQDLKATLTDANDKRFDAFQHLTDVRGEISKIREDANACVGETELFKQENGVQVTHPEIPDDPSAQNPFDVYGGDVEPPGYASPFN